MTQSQQSASLFQTEHLRELQQPRVAIVHTEWNEKIVAAQLEGCERILNGFGAIVIDKAVVPGSFEIPFACKRIWNHYELLDQMLQPEAIITFGAVIRGGTPHFEYVSDAVTSGIGQLNLTLPIPVIFGVLTLENEQQAWERLGGEHGHKGEEAAITALKMIYLCRNKGC